jgi:hypothetical protein
MNHREEREVMESTTAVELAAFKSAQKKCAARGIAFPYRSFTEFLRRVGRRPDGAFLSGRSMFALMKKNDRGEYEWRETSRRDPTLEGSHAPDRRRARLKLVAPRKKQ